jgi:hypothetical protein
MSRPYPKTPSRETALLQWHLPSPSLIGKSTHLFTKQLRRTDACNLKQPCSPRSVQAKGHALARETENTLTSVERSAEKVHDFLDKLHAFRKKVHRFYRKLHNKSN